MLFVRKTYVFDICENHLTEVILTNTKKLMIYKKKLVKSICYSCFRQVHLKFLYNSKFDLTAKSLVTNSVVRTRVLCIAVHIEEMTESETVLQGSKACCRQNILSVSKQGSISHSFSLTISSHPLMTEILLKMM